MDFKYPPDLSINKQRICAIIEKMAKRRDDEIRRMLKLWVSGLEPVIMIGPSPEHRLIGLGHTGPYGEVIQVIAAIDDCILRTVQEGHPDAF